MGSGRPHEQCVVREAQGRKIQGPLDSHGVPQGTSVPVTLDWVAQQCSGPGAAKLPQWAGPVHQAVHDPRVSQGESLAAWAVAPGRAHHSPRECPYHPQGLEARRTSTAPTDPGQSRVVSVALPGRARNREAALGLPHRDPVVRGPADCDVPPPLTRVSNPNHQDTEVCQAGGQAGGPAPVSPKSSRRRMAPRCRPQWRRRHQTARCCRRGPHRRSSPRSLWVAHKSRWPPQWPV